MDNTLALLGGEPVRKEPLPRYNTIGDAEKQAVMEVLESGELSGFVAGNIKEFWGGPRVAALESAFKEHFGSKYAIAVNSATSGLHCALNAMNIGPGDEVITSPYTMAATATTVLMTGAVPIFADIDPDTFCIDPKAVEEAITPQTKGIVAVNIFGHPAALDELRALADRHGLFLMEDNAQAPNADYHGRKTATIGDAGVFSFNRHKTMQCGEGGVVITDDKDIAFKAACMRNHGEVSVGSMQVKDIVNTIGVNYRMPEMEAAVALCQFQKLKELNDVRVKLADRLTERLAKVEGLTPPVVKDGCSHVYYFYCMKYDESVTGIPRKLFSDAVQAEGFNLRAGYVPVLYREPVYQQKLCFGRDGFPFSANPRYETLPYQDGTCPVAERMQDKELMVTNIIYPPLTVDDMDRFVDAVEKVISQKDALLAAKGS